MSRLLISIGSGFIALVSFGSLFAEESAFAKKPVQVYILAGQSNMVGIGQVYGSGIRWGKEYTDITVSAYEAAYDSKADYSKLKPISIIKPEAFGGTNPTPFPEGVLRVARGKVTMNQTGVYAFRPGYGDSQNCIMTVNSQEVHRQEPGQKAVRKTVKVEAGKALPFEIIYLTKGANGLGWHERVDIPGTLSTVVKEQGKFSYLLGEDGDWAPRQDVWYRGVVTATSNTWLAPGCGAGSGKQIGPELGFGHILGEHHDAPVLLLKASQGNRSLNWDFLPPGSKRFEMDGMIYAGYGDKSPSWEKGTKPKEVNWYAGKQYDDCFGEAQKLLANFDKSFPQFADLGYEIAGLVWWQGHKDSGSMVTANRYEQNLVQLIDTLRNEFKAPKAPFVVGTIGFGGRGMEKPEMLKIVDAQLAVDGDSGKHPRFKGNVKSVETRDFWISADKSPKNQDFHYNQNAETYMNVGLAFGEAMVELLRK